jgi:hypothetical protein
MAGLMRVGILDDEAADQMGRAHGQLQTDGCTEIVQVNEALLDVEPREQPFDAIGKARERGFGQDIRVTEARQVGRNDKCGPGQRLDDVAEITGRIRKAMQQHNSDLVAIARRLEREIDPAG